MFMLAGFIFLTASVGLISLAIMWCRNEPFLGVIGLVVLIVSAASAAAYGVLYSA